MGMGRREGEMGMGRKEGEEEKNLERDGVGTFPSYGLLCWPNNVMGVCNTHLCSLQSTE